MDEQKERARSEPVLTFFRRQRERCAVELVCSQDIKKPEPLSLRDPGVRPSYALHSLVVNSTLTPVAQNLHKFFIAHPMACQRFGSPPLPRFAITGLICDYPMLHETTFAL
jgi:hypothetical protein